VCASQALSDEQLDRRFEMGVGTLRNTLIHMIDAGGAWHAALTGTNDYQPLDPKASIDEITQKHATVAKSFATFCKTGSTADILNATRGTRAITVPRGLISTHFLTHGTHHRAQCLNMLRHLGVNPLPQSSVMQWAVATGAAQMKILEERKP
jgi:uncharacterized damage-inducible protein DinB